MNDKNIDLWNRAIDGINEKYIDESAEKIEEIARYNLTEKDFEVVEEQKKQEFPLLAIAAVIIALIGITAFTAVVINHNNSFGDTDSSIVTESDTVDEIIPSVPETTTETTPLPETTTSVPETTTSVPKTTPPPETIPEPYVPEDYSPTALYDYNDERVQAALKLGRKYPTVDYRDLPVIDLMDMLEADQLENCLYRNVAYPYYIEFFADTLYGDEYPPIKWNKNIPLCQLMYLSEDKDLIGVVYKNSDSSKVREEFYTTDFEIKFLEEKAFTMMLGYETTWDTHGRYECMFMMVS